MYFFIFSLQITKFPCKELSILPVFSRRGGVTTNFVLGRTEMRPLLPVCRNSPKTKKRRSSSTVSHAETHYDITSIFKVG